MEFRVSGVDGKRRWLAATWLSQEVPGRGGRRVVGTITDISERKDLEEQFLHAQKMQAVGSLAGGIAHDFNNLLTVILGAAQMAQGQAARLAGGEKLLADLDDILAAGERASVLTGQLLAFSRRQVVQPRNVQVVELVTGMAGMLNRLVGERISVVTSFESMTSTVWADPGQLTQVVMNLAVNARDAMPTGGTLHIRVATTDVVQGTVPPAADLTPGRYVTISVSDSGHGIDPAIAHLIFDPFFTSKPVGQGTGLGLSTVYGIARQWLGAVRFDSEPGRGTTFEVFLPVADGQAGGAAAVPVEPVAPGEGGGKVVLVAEDEPSLRRLVERVLVQANYTVLVASDGQTALDCSRAREGPVDLLLTDMVMPGISGLELVDILSRERPGVRVIMMSGYPTSAEAGDLTLGKASFLAKPFTPLELLDAVRRKLT
jgi:signal transduction histidine kinase